MRRPAHAAGTSWRKWEDPVVYKRLNGPRVWVWSIALGAWLGLAVAGTAVLAVGWFVVAVFAIELGVFSPDEVALAAGSGHVTGFNMP